MCVNFCRLFVSFELHAVSITRRFQFSCVTRRFLYTQFLPLSLLHADSVTHRFHYPRIQRSRSIVQSAVLRFHVVCPPVTGLEKPRFFQKKFLGFRFFRFLGFEGPFGFKGFF